MGYGDAMAVWRQAVVSHRVSFGLIDSLNRWGNCHAGGSEDRAAGAFGFAAESEVLCLVLDFHILQGL